MIAVRTVVGLLLSIVGVVWIGQGMGAIHGSFMTGHPVWAVIGVPCLIAGLAVVAQARRARRERADGVE